ncbi:carbamoyltransferase family protein [Opitutus terrae]|uniref:Carbamoyltransferase n=1 Tax=Opitutus terrae (strain DSM 11246 / JCM 15787 / PB90-1) TaxID=452637 RepID=B1ZSF7_OPITP|nr:carbamoyltransferase N-terminal domain-containing protein [Opitutus terrae]ACB73814.1 Carbamoyltransferase [Opitutus terrae PB90-1]
MRILGLSAFYHDSAAVLLDDGEIVAAVQEERFSRIKHDASFPRAAAAYCLAQASGPLDAVVYYEKPLLKFERILATSLAIAPRGFRAFAAAIPDWIHHKLWMPSLTEDELRALGAAPAPVFFAGHHESHAASAFFPSPFPHAAILTLDGVGEWSTTALGRGAGNRIELLRELRFPHSLGLLYSAFTHYCGFRVNSGEYKLMGLAPYGEPRHVNAILDRLVDLKPDGSFRLNLDYFGYLHGQTMTNARFAALFDAPPRAPDAPLTTLYCDVARSIQQVTEEIVLRLARTLHAETGEENLCLAGGVALNCVANGRLLREGPFRRIWVQPAAGDAGGALGAALAFHHRQAAAPRNADDVHDRMHGAFLGPSYGDDDIALALTQRGITNRLPQTADLPDRIAERLNAGLVVGFFQGRAEFGPRALGARSILADARSPEMQRRLNLKIKFRESFRPFAPIVLAEHASEWFDLAAASPYMLFTAPVATARRSPDTPRSSELPAECHSMGDISQEGGWQERLRAIRSAIPAVTHVDGSARVQTVDRQQNAALHAVLSAFARRTGCPVLVNTSFNVRGEPPVCHPREAIDCFLATDMDCLAIGSYLVDKTSLPANLRAPAAAPPRAFAAD